VAAAGRKAEAVRVVIKPTLLLLLLPKRTRLLLERGEPAQLVEVGQVEQVQPPVLVRLQEMVVEEAEL
jgi:hypothetical protein